MASSSSGRRSRLIGSLASQCCSAFVSHVAALKDLLDKQLQLTGVDAITQQVSPCPCLRHDYLRLFVQGKKKAAAFEAPPKQLTYRQILASRGHKGDFPYRTVPYRYLSKMR